MPNNELENDIVTFTKLQIALSAGVTSIQSELSKISLAADTETNAGLFDLLHEATECLLKHSAHWTHVVGKSETFPSREAAQIAFDKSSLKERRKYSAETLSNVEGKIQQQEVSPETEPGESAYVVVTVLVGTAHDRPLFAAPIGSAAALKSALNTLRSMSSDYLMILELLWTPQLESDTLTAGEMASEYADLIAI
jgi:uncharacterized membrane protein